MQAQLPSRRECFMARMLSRPAPPAPRRPRCSPPGRRVIVSPEEVTDLVLFLASERTGNVTGSDFVIDGGLIQAVRVMTGLTG